MNGPDCALRSSAKDRPSRYWRIPQPPLLPEMGGKARVEFSVHTGFYSEKAGPRVDAKALLCTIDPVKGIRVLEST
jgi:hypothetical protein